MTTMSDAPDHEHIWQDTGFATVEDCAVKGCRATRSGDGQTADIDAVTEVKVIRAPSTELEGDLVALYRRGWRVVAMSEAGGAAVAVVLERERTRVTPPQAGQA